MSDDGSSSVHPGAAVLGRDGDAEQAELAQLSEQWNV